MHIYSIHDRKILVGSEQGKDMTSYEVQKTQSGCHREDGIRWPERKQREQEAVHCSSYTTTIELMLGRGRGTLNGCFQNNNLNVSMIFPDRLEGSLRRREMPNDFCGAS